MFLSITGYSQCDSNKIIFVDSLGNEIESNQNNLIYNGNDTIHLDQLCDVDLKNPNEAFLGAPLIKSSSKYCIRCKEEAIKIVDSIDINHDGVKELFLFRQWYCSATPPDLGYYGEGGQQLSCSKYEVWDIKSKKKIFEVKNRLYNQVTVSTSVVKKSGYQFDVSINKFGSFIISNPSGICCGGGIQLGIYTYGNATKTYNKENNN